MELKVRAPGRVNIIGEHTDYNMGFVLPMAINRGIELKAISRDDDVVKLKALDLNEEASFKISELLPGNNKNWWDYLAGSCWALIEEGYRVKGAEIAFGGDLPHGSGLSSSAALEVATVAAFAGLNNIEISKKEIALLAQKAENQYVGVMCGIMDQFASALCETGNALFIDCRSYDYSHVPLDTEGYSFMIVDSRVKRKLSSSEYNKRREECDAALMRINENSGTNKSSLRDISITDIEKSKSILPENLYKRSRYVVEENSRVLEAVKALKNRDFENFGVFMNSSHKGLKELYEVSCSELDLIVDIMQSSPGVMGARMTGAGFGGCAVSLVHNDEVQNLQERLMRETKGELPESPGFYLTHPAKGLTVY